MRDKRLAAHEYLLPYDQPAAVHSLAGLMHALSEIFPINAAWSLAEVKLLG
jgi:hypothetical protein